MYKSVLLFLLGFYLSLNVALTMFLSVVTQSHLSHKPYGFMVQFYTEEGFLGLYMSYYIRTVYSYNIFGEKKPCHKYL